VENVHGEVQKTLDIIANELFLRRTEFGGHVAAMVCEEMDSIYQLPEHYDKGHYLLLYDPVDGSANLNENASFGTIFSILRRPEGASGDPDIAEFLQAGTAQVCAGYTIYGPSSMIVLTTGNGVNGFTLDPLVGEFILSHRGLTIPEDSPRFFINSAMSRHWDEPVRRFVEDCLRGNVGGVEQDFDMRWSAGAVPDVHRLLMGGGIYLNPGHARLREQGLDGKLRLLYEVNPLSFLVEQAGGVASTGEGRALEVQPESLHQRCPLFAGSRGLVELLVEGYLGEKDYPGILP